MALIEEIERLFPEKVGDGARKISMEPSDASFLDTFDLKARPIVFTGGGYLQFVHGNDLCRPFEIGTVLFG